MICDIYVECSLSWSEHSDAVVGIAMSIGENDAKTVYGYMRDVTQTEAIIVGITRALDYTKLDNIRLHLSNTLVANAIKQGWLDSWENNLYKNGTIKHADKWHELFLKLKGRSVELILNEFNGYRKHLRFECKQRMKKHERIPSGIQSSGRIVRP